MAEIEFSKTTIREVAHQLPTRARDLRTDATTLSANLSKLSALLEMTYGGARETFDGMNKSLRDNYLWACADLANDCQALAESLNSEIHRGGGVVHG